VVHAVFIRTDYQGVEIGSRSLDRCHSSRGADAEDLLLVVDIDLLDVLGCQLRQNRRRDPVLETRLEEERGAEVVVTGPISLSTRSAAPETIRVFRVRSIDGALVAQSISA